MRGIYTRQQLAAHFGISTHTIRKYVRNGHIPPPTHTNGPPERYHDGHIRAIEKIRRDVIDHNRTLAELHDMPDFWNPNVDDDDDEVLLIRMLEGPGSV